MPDHTLAKAGTDTLGPTIELARTPAVTPTLLSAEQIQLLKDTIAKGTTDIEFKFGMEVIRRKNFDPFAKHVHFIKRWDATLKREVMTIQTGIDGLRLIAKRSDRYEGQEGPFWCGPDGKWVDVWLNKFPPAAAKVGVFCTGFQKPIYAVALYAEYVQLTRDGKVNSMWARMPAGQLAKCAEALALRKSFPEELSGLYAPEEIDNTAPPAPQIDKKNVPDAVKYMWSTMASIAATCKVFAELKAQLLQVMGPAGETEYYRILRESGGVAHANEFRNSKPARDTAYIMWLAIEQAEALHQPVEDEPSEPAVEREPGEGE